MVVFGPDLRQCHHAMTSEPRCFARHRLGSPRRGINHRLGLVAYALALFFLGLAQNSPAQTNTTQTGLLSPATNANAVTNGPVVNQAATASHVPIVTNVPVATHAATVRSVPTATNAPVASTPERPDYTKYAALLVSFLALGYTIWKDYRTDQRMKRIEEEQEREKKETAVRRSKASAPYFSPSKKLVQMVYETTDDGGICVWHGGNVLSIDQREIPADAPEATPVIVLLDTGGKGARHIRIAGDIPGLELKQEPDINDAHGLLYLKYPFAPSQRGETQKVILSFETEDGLDLTHTYETRHGCFEFYRVDPK